MKLYDKKNKRILMFEKEATPGFWDECWDVDNFVEKVKGAKNRFIKRYTRKFLKPGARILEGGCGIGQIVYGLKSWGYDSYGVDFAEKTVKRIKKDFPELKVSIQDVRKLDFPDNFFDGYWSLGVIEHFWEGYNEILSEAKRVIKSGGYLFLTFPYMSPLRKLKAKLGFYKIWRTNLMKKDDFYQFVLDIKNVKVDVEKYKFKLVCKHSLDGIKGLKDEVFWLKPILQKIYDSQTIIAKGIKSMSSILFSKATGHIVLLVFKKL